VLNKYITGVGFGNAIDQQGRGYTVRLFSTNQKGDIDPATRRVSVQATPKKWS
jgi:hypothetical protein